MGWGIKGEDFTHLMQILVLVLCDVCFFSIVPLHLALAHQSIDLLNVTFPSRRCTFIAAAHLNWGYKQNIELKQQQSKLLPWEIVMEMGKYGASCTNQGS